MIGIRPTSALYVLAFAGLAGVPLEAQSGEGGQLDGSPALFAVLTAINSAGYDADLQSPSNHPLRAAIRARIAQTNPACLPRLKQFFEAHRKWNWNAELSQYISYALTLDGPPSFKPRYPINQMPPDAAALEGFGPLVAEFWQQAGLEELWTRSQPAFEEAIAKYHEPVSQAILDANMYMRNPTSGVRGRRFQVYVDLLGAPNQVHTRSYSDDYFVVVTSSGQPRVRDIRHSYLHYALDPLCIRNAGLLEKKRGLGDLANASPILDEAYKNDFVLLTGMSLVKAVEARMDGKAGSAAVEQAMKEGFILTAYFHEALVTYEKQEQALRLYLPTMFELINVNKEDKRISQVEFVSKSAERTVKPVEVAPAPLEGVEKSLAEAETLYGKRDLEGARKLYRQALEIPDSRLSHARAYFGLARIAILEKNPELAQQLFEKTIELKPDAFERAWAYVYLARLSVAAQEPAEARKNYEAALAVEGASEGARKAAKQEMESLAAKIP